MAWAEIDARCVAAAGLSDAVAGEAAGVEAGDALVDLPSQPAAALKGQPAAAAPEAEPPAAALLAA